MGSWNRKRRIEKACSCFQQGVRGELSQEVTFVQRPREDVRKGRAGKAERKAGAKAWGGPRAEPRSAKAGSRVSVASWGRRLRDKWLEEKGGPRSGAGPEEHLGMFCM